jgi:hypothetical protein
VAGIPAPQQGFKLVLLEGYLRHICLILVYGAKRPYMWGCLHLGGETLAETGVLENIAITYFSLTFNTLKKVKFLG